MAEQQEETKSFESAPIIGSPILTDSILKALIDSTPEAIELLRMVGDLYEEIKMEGKKEVKRIKMGENKLINKIGFRRIIIILRSASNTNIGLGYRTEERINEETKYIIVSFIRNLEDNIDKWEINFYDCRTIIDMMKIFINSALRKSRKGMLTKSLGGSMRSTETSTREGADEGKKGFFPKIGVKLKDPFKKEEQEDYE